MSSAPTAGPSQCVRPPSTLITITSSGIVSPKTPSTVTKPICSAYSAPDSPPMRPESRIAHTL